MVQTVDRGFGASAAAPADPGRRSGAQRRARMEQSLLGGAGGAVERGAAARRGAVSGVGGETSGEFLDGVGNGGVVIVVVPRLTWMSLRVGEIIRSRARGR
jgi:hypothetical protein